jgi:hypothetical protein
VNFTFDTITPVHELVIVIPDLYLSRERRDAFGQAVVFADIPGIESVARFGARAPLAGGWRAWLPRRIGRADLEGVAPVYIAAAALDAAPGVVPAHTHAASVGTSWIARAVHLHAGLTQVHLDQRGLLRLPAAEQATLAAEFARTFGSSHYSLAPLPFGEFLLSTPGLTPVATEEPGRCAGGELAELIPAGPAAAPLRRLLSEMEMWLHAQPLNEARQLRGAAPVTALWPWGAAGRIVRAQLRAQSELPTAFGRDAWLEGLWRLQGAACRSLPQHLDEVFAAGVQAAVLLVDVGGELGDEQTVAGALSRLDAHFVLPALQALRRGSVEVVTVIINDVRAHVQRGSLRRFWRRSLAGLAGFA